MTLLIWGVGGMAGAFCSGPLTDRWGPDRTLTLAIVVLAISLVLPVLVSSVPLVMLVMAVDGAAGWAVATPNNHRLTEYVPHLPSVVISFDASGIYIGQAIGAVLGGFLLAGVIEPAELCYVGAGTAVLAGLVHLAVTRTHPAPLTRD